MAFKNLPKKLLKFLHAKENPTKNSFWKSTQNAFEHLPKKPGRVLERQAQKEARVAARVGHHVAKVVGVLLLDDGGDGVKVDDEDGAVLDEVVGDGVRPEAEPPVGAGGQQGGAFWKWWPKAWVATELVIAHIAPELGTFGVFEYFQ